MMQVQVDSLIRVPATAPVKVLEHVRARLTMANPDHARRMRLGLSTWNIPSEICCLADQQDGSWTAPRGSETARIITEACQKAGEPLQWLDRRRTFRISTLPCNFTLRTYQQAAVDVLARRYQGIAQAPCGAGKTVLGAGLIARCGQPSLVLVHTHDLVDQWRQTLHDCTGQPVGVWSGGERHASHLTVATVQSLAKLSDNSLDGLGQLFGLVLVDEAHHAPAATFTDVLAHIPARYRVGLTATPTREDGLTPLIGWSIGPVVYEIGHQELIDAGHLVVPKVIKVETGCDVDADDYAGLIKGLEADELRLAKVVELCLSEERSTLILSNRVAYCKHIAERIWGENHWVEEISGKTPKKQRQSTLQRFRSGQLRILCATTLADEGLDISRLECLILALPSRAQGRTIQRLGRLMRPHEGKRRPVLYDLVDDHPIAWQQWLSRRRAYRKVLGKGAVV